MDMATRPNRRPIISALSGWGSAPLPLLPSAMLRFFERAAMANEPAPALPAGHLNFPPAMLGADCWTNIPNAQSLTKELEELATFYARLALDSLRSEPIC